LAFLAGFENQLRSIQFSLRQKAWGRLKLRRRLPEARSEASELELYLHFTQLARSCTPTSATSDVIDVGCRNWSYVGALRQAFPNARLLGIELDGYRRYFNLFRRIDFARAFAKHADAQVFHADFLSLSKGSLNLGPSPLFVFFFPFVSDHPCLKWGLPTQYVDFLECLRHARALAAEGPFAILSVHQGEWEGELAAKIYSSFMTEMRAKPLQQSTLSPEFLGAGWRAPFPVKGFFLESAPQPHN
jgi:hypothetical protein